ncbi:hypothetical protein [Streptomyces sp. SGAir0957]
MTSKRRQLVALGVRTLPVRVLGVALVVVAVRPWETVHGLSRAVPFWAVVLFAAWAAPGVDRRPTAASPRRLDQVARHRTTLLAAVAVSLAAVGGGVSGWQGLCAAVLLVGYLVASDPWSTGVRGSGLDGGCGARRGRRLWGPGWCGARGPPEGSGVGGSWRWGFWWWGAFWWGAFWWRAGCGR